MTQMKQRRRRSPNGQTRPYRDGDRWIAPETVTFPDGTSRKVRGSGATQLKAQDNLRRRVQKVLDEFEREQETRDAHLFVNPATEAWLTGVAPNGREHKTVEGYWHAYRVWIKPRFDGIRLVSVDYAALSALQRDVLAQKSASTWRQVRTVLNHVLKDAGRHGIIALNPMSLLPNTKGPKVSADYLTIEEAQAVITTARAQDSELRWLLSLSTGMRQGECLGLRWCNVDLDGAQPQIRIREQIQRQTGRGLVLKTPKSLKSIRTIPLDPTMVRAFKDHRRRQVEARLLAGSMWQDSGHVFTTPIGTPVDAANDRKAWLSTLESAGVRKIKLHGARHTAATLMFANDTPIYTVSSVLGHSSISVTADVYGHVMSSAVGEAVAELARALA